MFASNHGTINTSARSPEYSKPRLHCLSAGMRYVVDAGRSKQKILEEGGSLAQYDVRWISKASAQQRAGRSGRTGPGHCYRSAFYCVAIFVMKCDRLPCAQQQHVVPCYVQVLHVVLIAPSVSALLSAAIHCERDAAIHRSHCHT